MKNKTFIKSLKCAIVGFWFALKTEKNFRYYLGIVCFFTLLNVVFDVNYLAYLTMLVTVMGAFSAECINTALEHLIDMIDKNIREEIRIIKDVAAGGVLCWGIAFFVSEFIWLGMAIL